MGTGEVGLMVVDNVNLVAFLESKGIVAIPFIKEEAKGEKSSQVAWEIREEDVPRAKIEITMFYANEFVGVRDFTRMLASVRKDMYDVKLANNQLKGSS